MLEKEVDNMDKNELLIKIEKIIKSGNYEIEELLEVIPDNLLEEVINMVEIHTKHESAEIQNDLKNRTK